MSYIATNLVIKYYFPAIQIVLMVVLTILVIYMSTQIASKSIIKISKKKK